MKAPVLCLLFNLAIAGVNTAFWFGGHNPINLACVVVNLFCVGVCVRIIAEQRP